jgi:hypothetical protein
MSRAGTSIDHWKSMGFGDEDLYWVLKLLDNPGGGAGAAGPSDVTDWLTFNVDETKGVDQTIAANPLRGQPGTPFRTVAFALTQIPSAGNDYNVWANQKVILHLGSSRFTTAVQGATITINQIRRTIAIHGFGAIVESAFVFNNNKALYPDGVAFDSTQLPAPWNGVGYGGKVGIELTGLSESSPRQGDDQPGLVFLGAITFQTTATVGGTLQPFVQAQRVWVNNDMQFLGSNLSQSELPLDVEDCTFGTQPGRGGPLYVLGCDGPAGALNPTSLLLSAKRSNFYSRIGPFVTFGDCEDCLFVSIHYDLDFAGAPVDGVARSANDGGFYNCVFQGGAAPLGMVLGTSVESSLPFRADDNSLVSMAAATPTFDSIQSVGLDVSDLTQLYVATTGSPISARGISAVPFNSIAAAVAVAQEGDTINIEPGDYTDHVIWKAGIAHLNFIGKDASSTRISPILANAPPFRILDAAARGGRVANLTFVKSGNLTAVACVRVENVAADPDFLADGLVFDNVIAERNDPGGAAAGLHEAFYISGASKVTFYDCKGGISDLNNRDLNAYNCQIAAQGDVPNALTCTGPVLGILAGTWKGSRYHACEVHGDTENAVPGIRLGGTPWIEMGAECQVFDSIQSLSTLVDADGGLQFPRIVMRARFEPSSSHSLVLACTATPAVLDFDDVIFASEGLIRGTLTIEAVAGAVRQPFTIRNATLNTLAMGSRLDASTQGTSLASLTATLGANGSTCDRNAQVQEITLDGAGGQAINNVIPWPTGVNVQPFVSYEEITTPLTVAIVASGLSGPSAGGTVAIKGEAGTANQKCSVALMRVSP